MGLRRDNKPSRDLTKPYSEFQGVHGTPSSVNTWCVMIDIGATVCMGKKCDLPSLLK